MSRVCIVDADGCLRQQVAMNRCQHLPVDTKGNIFAADMLNERVVLINSSLTDTIDFIALHENSSFRFPVRLCLDESRQRLYVATCERHSVKQKFVAGVVMVFKVVKDATPSC